VLFLTASLLLPYVPTVLASALVLFLGIELMLEAVWESAQSLILLEWCIVIGTLMSCTFIGFAEGFGVGIGAAAVVYLAFGVVDSVQYSVFYKTSGKLTRIRVPVRCDGKNGMRLSNSFIEPMTLMFPNSSHH